MKHCINCQSENDFDALFCATCGEKLPTDSPVLKNQSTAEQKRSSGIHSTWKIIAGGVFIIAVAVGFSLYLTHTIKKDTVSEIKKAIPDVLMPKIEIEKVIPDIPKSKEKIQDATDKIFGDDTVVGEPSGDAIKLSLLLKDTENADNYSYKRTDCSTLLTDSVQQIGYQVQKEVAHITKISEEEENKIGREIARHYNKKFKNSLDTDPKTLDYIRKIGKQLISRVERKGIDYHFHIVENKAFNAFAIPGGGIYVYTGLINQIRNEAQLAAVLAHEIKHIDLRHCIFITQMIKKLPEAIQKGQYAYIAGQMITNPYSVRQEMDADRRGIDLSYSFGYSPYQAVRLWEERKHYGKSSGKTEKPTNSNVGNILGSIFKEVENVMQTHPGDLKRACMLRNYIIKLNNEYKQKLFYVGHWNLKNRISMFEKLK